MMSGNKTFHETVAEHLETLKLYVPIVARVHGGEHPEFHDVRKQCDSLIAKIEQAGELMPDLGAEFDALRGITNRYEVPSDTCESYEAVYDMLAAMDESYTRENER